MDPRIDQAESRLNDRKEDLQQSEMGVETWNKRHEKYKAEAVATLNDRREKAKALKMLDNELEQVQLRQEAAVRSYDAARTEAAHDVEAYRYVEAKYKAVLS